MSDSNNRRFKINIVYLSGEPFIEPFHIDIGIDYIYDNYDGKYYLREIIERIHKDILSNNEDCKNKFYQLVYETNIVYCNAWRDRAYNYCYYFEFNSKLEELTFSISINDNLMLDIIENCKLGIKDCIKQEFEHMAYKKEFDYMCSYESLLNIDDDFYYSTYASEVFNTFEKIKTDFFILTLEYEKNLVLINDTLKTSLTKIIITFDINTKNINVSFYNKEISQPIYYYDIHNKKISQPIYYYDIYLDIDLLKFYRWTYCKSIGRKTDDVNLEPYLNMFDYIFDNIKLIELTDNDTS
jgi:hypothetical protein